MDTLKKLNELFRKREKKKFLLLLFMMLIAGLFETAGVGLIVPFVTIVTNPDMIYDNVLLYSIYNFFQFESTHIFTIFSAIALLLFFVIKNMYLLLFYYIQYRIIFNEQVNLTHKLFQTYMLKPYTFHVQRNSAQLLRNINISTRKVFTNVVIPILVFIKEAIMIICILILLLLLEPIATIASMILISTSVVVFFKLFNTRIRESGKEQEESSKEMIQWVNQGLGAIKDVRVLGREGFFISQLTDASKKYSSAMRFYSFIKQVPRSFIEVILVASILMIILIVLLQSNDMNNLIASAALFAMAAFRIAPSVTALAQTQTTIKNNLPALESIYNDLIEDGGSYNTAVKEKTKSNCKDYKDKYHEKTFIDTIKVSNIEFVYPNTSDSVLKNVSLEIPIGKSVAFVGSSGSGKTTLIDIILGLLQPPKWFYYC